MKLMEKMKKRKLGNKGFSLVEMIIVIAIMAILIGIVGTQVVPYLKEAREAKDMAILDAFATSAVSCYSFNSELLASAESQNGYIALDVFNEDNNGFTNSKDSASGRTIDNVDRAKWQAAFERFTGYKCDDTGLDKLKEAMSSADGRAIKGIIIVYNFRSSDLPALYGKKVPAGSVTAFAYKNSTTDIVLELATAPIGSQQSPQ